MYCAYFRFVPYKPGRYTVDVRCGGQSIENSPFVMKISEAEAVSVKLKEFEKQVTFLFDLIARLASFSQGRSSIICPLILEERRTEEDAVINSLSL